VINQISSSQSYFSSAPDGLALLSANGIVLQINPAALEFLNINEESALNSDFKDFISPDDRELFLNTSANLVSDKAKRIPIRFHKGNQRFALSDTFLKKIGSDILLSFRPQLEISSKSEHRAMVGTDILPQVMEYLPNMFFAKDLEGRYIFANRATQIFFDKTASEIYGKTDYELFPSELAFSLRQADQMVLEMRGPVQCEELITDFSGQTSDHWTVKFPLRDSSGEITAVCGIATDMTDLKNHQSELLKTQQRHASHVQRTPLGVVEFDMHGMICDWNPAAKRIFGYSKEEILGKHWSFLVPDGPERMATAETWEQIQKQTGGFVNCNQNLTKDGRILICEWHNTPLIDSSGVTVGAASLVQDITERIRTKKLIEEQRARITAASKMSALGEMAAGIAHEVNNPLTIIAGNAYHIQSILDKSTTASMPLSNKANERIHAHAERIVQTCHRIAKIISGLRFFARDGEKDLNETKTVATLIEETLAFCQKRFANHEINLCNEMIAEDLILNCRPVQISQVLLNLLNNAFDAVVDTPNAWVQISCASQGKFAEIRITDSGTGIPEPIASQIMNPFFTTKGSHQGTGLGLSISNGIIESHQGSLKLDPTHPNTSFVIRLPRVQIELPIVDQNRLSKERSRKEPPQHRTDLDFH
jgi:PAS domain S-box-containing protein